MQAPAWVNLFRRVPPAQHDCLILVTANKTEIVLQRLVRLEDDYLVGLGRLAGSTDQGKLLIIPYDQLTYVSFNKRLTDAEIGSVLGEPGIGAEVAPNVQQPAASGESVSPADAANPDVNASNLPASATTDTPPLGDPAGQSPAKPAQKAPLPSKSVLLARLRQRLSEDAGKHLKP
jgi:hypothetical protein